MKQLLIAVFLVLLLPISAFINGHLLTERCDSLLNALNSDPDTEGYADKISVDWTRLKTIAAYTSPYDLIRAANNAYEAYFSWLSNDCTSTDFETAKVQFEACLRDLRRIHGFSLELIF